MAKILYFFALVAVIQVASALQCYTCENGICPPEQDKWQKVPSCGNTGNSQVNTGACLKEVYTDKTGKEIVSRRCIIAEKTADGKLSHKCNEKDGKVSVCEVCNTDLCNSAPVVSFNLITLLGVVAAYLIPKYL